MTASSPLTPRQNAGWGLFLIGLSLGMGALIHFRPEPLQVPAWVAYTAISSFFFAGLLMLATSAGKARLEGWLAVGVTLALLLPAAWFAVGAGERRCSSNVPFFSQPPAAACRTAFGIGALITALVLIWFVRLALRPPKAG